MWDTTTVTDGDDSGGDREGEDNGASLKAWNYRYVRRIELANGGEVRKDYGCGFPDRGLAGG